jgi:hypothetical protein
MERIKVLVVLAVLALAAAPALAEGHVCRNYYPYPYYGGYWLWVECPGDVGRSMGKWTGWMAEPYWQDVGDPEINFHAPYYY